MLPNLVALLIPIDFKKRSSFTVLALLGGPGLVGGPFSLIGVGSVFRFLVGRLVVLSEVHFRLKI